MRNSIYIYHCKLKVMRIIVLTTEMLSEELINSFSYMLLE